MSRQKIFACHGRYRVAFLVFVLVTGFALPLGCQRTESQSVGDKSMTADQIMRKMVVAYRHAAAYRDQAVVRLTYRRDGRRYEDEAPLSVVWQKPNRLQAHVYQTRVVSDGTNVFAKIYDQATQDFDGQVVVRPAAKQLTVARLFEQDAILNLAFRQGLVGYPLQLDLLLSEKPLALLLDDDKVTRSLLEPAEIGARTCDRVQIESSDGVFVFWIDGKEHVLRRVEYPAATFAPEIANDPTVADLELTIEFQNAVFDPQVSEETFAFFVPTDAKRVRKFVSPPRQLPSDLFGKDVAPFAFTRPGGDVVSSGSMGDRIKVLVWFTNHPASRTTLQQVDRVFQQRKDRDRIAFLGICAEPSSFADKDLEQLTELWQVQLPIVRDLQAYGRDRFHIPWAPTMVITDGKNVVQAFEVGVNPNLAAQLPEMLKRLSSGDDLAGEILKRFQVEREAYARSLQRGEPQLEAVSTMPPAAETTSR